tara:strand:+ start:3078 stop:3437 length:360 start_codon:yes stop_codon:yes gene_type:complete
MTNPLKGEIEIELGGETYKCRLTIDSLVKIEDELDSGILELAADIAQAKVRMRTLIVVLRYALRGGGNDYDERKIKEILTGTGIIKASTVVAQLLADSLSDPDEDEEESTGKKSQESAK